MIQSKMSEPEYDLCVVGAGSGGIGAALAAARMGLSVLLIEKSASLGGNAVRGGVHNWEPGVGGTAFPFEIFQRLQKIPGAVAIVRMARHCAAPQPGQPVYPGGEALPDPAATYADSLQRHSLKELSPEEKFGRSSAFRSIVFEPEAYSRVVGEMLAETGKCTVLTNTAFSEVTKVAVITDTERDVKMMILDQHLLPVVALVDYELTLSMPAPLTAHVGVDTLTHGIEAYVSRKASEMTDPIALSCIRLAATHLVKAWEEPENLAAREGMMLSATQGGMAFANSSVCLVHGMSRPLGLLFHIPHGLSNAMLLPAVTRFSLAGAEARYATVARTMGLCAANASDASAAASLVEGLEKLNARLEVPRIRDFKGATLEVFEAALEKMASDALASGSPANNPVVPTASEIVQLYREAW